VESVLATNDKYSNWRTRVYGRISGAALEQGLAGFEQAWLLKSSLKGLVPREEQILRVRMMAAIPNWANYYRLPLMELLRCGVASSGLTEIVRGAAGKPDPQIAFMDAVKDMPDPELSSAALAPVFAMVGNAEAIAQYSMSINDMLKLAASRSDPSLIRKAISIDAYVLTLPFVISQIRLGQLDGDMSGPEFWVSGLRGPDKRRSVYTKLRWTEYLLREMGAFEACSESEIHDLIVNRLGIYDGDSGDGDSKKALFALFRKWWKSVGN
jgi:hypothetical protein